MCVFDISNCREKKVEFIKKLIFPEEKNNSLNSSYLDENLIIIVHLEIKFFIKINKIVLLKIFIDIYTYLRLYNLEFLFTFITQLKNC